MTGQQAALLFFVLVPILLLGASFTFVLRYEEGRNALRREWKRWREAPFVTFSAIALAAIFVLGSIPKLAGIDRALVAFDRWGYPDDFIYLIGGIELVAGIALLSTRAAPIAASVLSVVMFGAIVTHLWFGSFVTAAIPTLVFFALAYVGGARQLQRMETWRGTRILT